MEMKEIMLSSKEIYNGRVLRLTVDKVQVPGGGEAGREIVHHNGGVCCAPINANGELAFVRQFRYAYGEVLLELPAGKLEIGEQPFDAIQREVKEEIGAVGTDWQDLGEFYPTPGYCTEVIHLYSCKIKEIGETDFDEDENLETVYVKPEDAVQMVLRGEIKDGKTQVLVLKLAQLLK